MKYIFYLFLIFFIFSCNNDSLCDENSKDVDGVCECIKNYHEENDTCISNTKKVNCKAETLINNAEAIITEVEVRWSTEENMWIEPASCEWKCKEGYKLTDLGCEKK